MLTEVDRYDEWNPHITRASGRVEEGATVDLQYTHGEAEADVLIVRPLQKIEWRSRTIAPGVLDLEQIFRVIPERPGSFHVVQDVRIEGVLALVSDLDDERAGLQAMLAAIARVAPTYQSSSS